MPGASWREVEVSALGWLKELDPEGETTGFDVDGLPDAAWVLNAMYEWEKNEVAVTHHQVRQSLVDAHLVEADLVGSVNLDGVPGLITTGGGLGRSSNPGPGWRRLRWAELAERLDEPVVPVGVRPCYRCLSGAHFSGSWPANIQPPSEGSLDREGWYRLMDLLIRWSPKGRDTPCAAYFSPCQSGWQTENGNVVAGRLGDAADLYDHPLGDGSPANLWAADRSWVTWSDWDLWGTKFSGPSGLVETLLNDGELETVQLSWC